MLKATRMDKKHIITIAGKPGSGKSTTSKGVANELGYDHFSSGDLFRSIAKERGIDVYEINLLAETEKEIDYEVDDRLKKMGREEDELVIDSRMAWHWMPRSFKVYLDLDLREAAARILSNMNEERKAIENIPNSPEEYATELQKRLDSESKRYLTLYDANPYNTEHYDLVVDSGTLGPDEVIDLVIKKYRQWLGEE